MQGDLSFFFLSSIIRYSCCRKQLQVESNHYCALIPIITDICSKTTSINIWAYKQTTSSVSLFYALYHNYSCNCIFVYMRAGAMAASFRNHYSHRKCCIWVSGVPFAFTLSPVKMVVDKGRKPKKPLATPPSSISLDLHPQMEKKTKLNFSLANHNPKCVYAITELL